MPKSGGNVARINIEDSIYRDSRFLKLVIMLGCEFKALGLMVSAWSLAQKYYLNEQTNRLIEKSGWLTTDYLPLLTVGLAEEREAGFYVKGSDEQFGWLIQKQNAGKLGGRPKKSESGRLSGKSGRLSGKSGSITKESGPNPLTLTPTLSLTQEYITKEDKSSLVSSTANNSLVEETKKARVPISEKIKNGFQQISPEIVESWVETYGDREFVIQELKKARSWLLSNPTKAPRSSYPRFLNSWLSRGWEQYRKTLKSNPTMLTEGDVGHLFDGNEVAYGD